MGFVSVNSGAPLSGSRSIKAALRGMIGGNVAVTMLAETES